MTLESLKTEELVKAIGTKIVWQTGWNDVQLAMCNYCLLFILMKSTTINGDNSQAAMKHVSEFSTPKTIQWAKRVRFNRQTYTDF